MKVIMVSLVNMPYQPKASFSDASYIYRETRNNACNTDTEVTGTLPVIQIQRYKEHYL